MWIFQDMQHCTKYLFVLSVHSVPSDWTYKELPEYLTMTNFNESINMNIKIQVPKVSWTKIKNHM